MPSLKDYSNAGGALALSKEEKLTLAILVSDGSSSSWQKQLGAVSCGFAGTWAVQIQTLGCRLALNKIVGMRRIPDLQTVCGRWWIRERKKIKSILSWCNLLLVMGFKGDLGQAREHYHVIWMWCNILWCSNTYCVGDLYIHRIMMLGCLDKLQKMFL